jgi:hypothetical protein
MGIMIMGAVVSFDGYIADTNGDVGPRFDWNGIGDVERTSLPGEAARC